MVPLGSELCHPNPFDFAQGSAALEAATRIGRFDTFVVVVWGVCADKSICLAEMTERFKGESPAFWEYTQCSRDIFACIWDYHYRSLCWPAADRERFMSN
jgi:hypothetical protein